jgi:hypothetical protein
MSELNENEDVSTLHEPSPGRIELGLVLLVLEIINKK